jgi:hypothetical protein
MLTECVCFTRGTENLHERSDLEVCTYVAGRITDKTVVKGMELAMTMEMDKVRVARDSAG